MIVDDASISVLKYIANKMQKSEEVTDFECEGVTFLTDKDILQEMLQVLENCNTVTIVEFMEYCSRIDLGLYRALTYMIEKKYKIKH